MRGGGEVGVKKWGGYTARADNYGKEITKGYNFNLMTVISWQLGYEVEPSIMRLINNPWGNQILVFP